MASTSAPVDGPAIAKIEKVDATVAETRTTPRGPRRIDIPGPYPRQ